MNTITKKLPSIIYISTRDSFLREGNLGSTDGAGQQYSGIHYYITHSRAPSYDGDWRSGTRKRGNS